MGFTETRGVHSRCLIWEKSFSFLDGVEVLNNPYSIIETKSFLFACTAASGGLWEFVQVFRFGPRETRSIWVPSWGQGSPGCTRLQEEWWEGASYSVLLYGGWALLLKN